MNTFDEITVTGASVLTGPVTVPVASAAAHPARKEQLDSGLSGKQAAHALLTQLAGLGAGGGYLKKGAGDTFTKEAQIPRADIALSFVGHVGVAFVDGTGNNSTAAIGDPSKAYATVQAAFNAGARVFSLGVGTFAGLDCGGSAVNLVFLGRGKAKTELSFLRGMNVTVQDIGFQSVKVTLLAGSEETTVGPVINAVGCWIETLNASAGDPSESAGLPGGNGGVVSLDFCWVGTFSADGGRGQGGGSEVGGVGGSGGVLTAGYTYFGTGSLAGGLGGGDGDLAGDTGEAGSATLRFCSGDDLTWAGYAEQPTWIQGSGALHFASIAAGTDASLTITLLGAQVGRPVVLGLPNVSTGLVFSARVIYENFVTINARNVTASAIAPGSATFTVMVKA